MHLLKRLGASINHHPARALSLFLVAVVLPAILLSYLAVRVFEDHESEQALAEARQVSRLSRALLGEELRHNAVFVESFVSRVTFNDAWRAHDDKAVAAQLRLAHELRPDLSFLEVLTIDGELRAISPESPGLLHKNFSQRDWYRGVMRTKKTYTSESYEGPFGSRPSIVAVATPIRGPSGEMNGIFVAGWNTELLATGMSGNTGFGSQWEISLVDDEGRIAARSAAGPADFRGYAPLAMLARGQETSGIYARGGTTYFVATSRIPQFGWGVMVEQPRTAVLGALNQVRMQMFFLTVIFAMMALLLAIFIGRLYRQLETGNRFLELSLDLFCVADFQGHFTYVNPAWRWHLGYSEAELLSRPYLEFVHPDDQEATGREAAKLADHGVTLLFKNRYQRADGQYRWLLWNAISSPKTKAIYAVAHDVTEQKLYELRIEQQNHELEIKRAEAERATQMKSQFLASMSHELRTPLNAILGFSELLEDETVGPLVDKQKRFVSHIRTGAKHLLQLINDILDLSKIEAGQLDLQWETFGAYSTVPEVVSLIRPLAMGKRVRLEAPKPTHDPLVRADRVRFKQILYNLLSNAVKFTPENGCVTLTVDTEKNGARITVSDTGVGIAPEDQESIFEEFRQVGESAGKQQGTGLGLAITRRLLQQQSATIHVESELGKGSRFILRFPPTPEVPFPEATDAPAVVRPRPLVLIVDDDAVARHLLASFLVPEGFDIREAVNGDEAVAMARDLRPDAITLDILMPGGGWQTLLELKKDPTTREIPVVVVTIVDQKNTAFALGAADYLQKPVSRDVLLRALRRQLSPAPHPQRILVIDDNEHDLQLIRDVLESVGFVPVLAGSGEEGLDLMRRHAHAAILLDLMMPNVDGFEVLRRMKQDDRLRSTPVFILTAKDLSSEEMRFLTREAQALLAKAGPWKEDLLLKMRQVLLRRGGNA